MNMLAQIDENQKTMSSREIAELSGKQHGHVCRDAEVLNTTYEKMGLSKIGQGYYTHPNTGSQQHREFLLTKEQCIDLVTGYNAELRIKINRRWQELEKQAQSSTIVLPDFTDPAEAAIAWAEQFKAKQLAEHQVSILTPKALALDTIANTEGTYTIRECAKTIGIGERKLVQMLLDKKWVFRESDGRLQPYAEKTTAGIFINRPSPVITNKNTGEERVHLHMRITAFGLTRITGLVNRFKGVAA